MKQHLFRLSLFVLVCLLLEVAGALLLKAYSTGMDYENIRNYQKIRRNLRGEPTPEDLPRFTGQAYLNYIMTPDFTENGVSLVNSAGYRGKEIPVKKENGVLRILFLGGSTTFSTAVYDTEKTFPAICGELLQKHLDTTSSPYHRVEALNVGLSWATTFELLTHYLFKYKYYNSDIVVIHEGGNDAQSYYFSKNGYSTDYSHWRKNMENIHPLPQISRSLLHSRFLSFVVIHLFYSHAEQNFFVHQGNMQPAQWHHPPEDFPASLDTTMNAFYQNMKVLIREVKSCNAQVVMVPFIFNEQFDYNEVDSFYLAGIRVHNRWMKQMSTDYQTAYVDLKNTDITNVSYWVDDCHLNADGEKLKAGKIAPVIVQLLNNQ